MGGRVRALHDSPGGWDNLWVVRRAQGADLFLCGDHGKKVGKNISHVDGQNWFKENEGLEMSLKTLARWIWFIKHWIKFVFGMMSNLKEDKWFLNLPRLWEKKNLNDLGVVPCMWCKPQVRAQKDWFLSRRAVNGDVFIFNTCSLTWKNNLVIWVCQWMFG